MLRIRPVSFTDVTGGTRVLLEDIGDFGEIRFVAEACPKCWEPYMLDDPDGKRRGCVNHQCSNYRDDAHPHWAIINDQVVLVPANI